MESIPQHSILQYNLDTMVAVRKRINLDQPGDMGRAIDILEDWVQKQEHFTKKDFSRQQLERFLISGKGSIERTKNQLDRLCTLRTLLPRFFEKCDAKNDFKHIRKQLMHGVLPKLTPDHYRVYMGKILCNVLDAKAVMSGYQFAGLFCEYFKSFDYCNGVIGIVDLRDIDLMEFVKSLNVTDLRDSIMIAMEGYDLLAEGIHILSTSKAIDILLRICKQLLSKKMGERIHVHRSLESLYENVPRKLLPADYGGDEKPLHEICDDWIDVLSTEKHIVFFKEMRNAQTNEALRHPETYYDDQYLGTAGTFRNLNID